MGQWVILLSDSITIDNNGKMDYKFRERDFVIAFVVSFIVFFVVGFYGFPDTSSEIVWETYENEEYGFSLEHPSTWKIEEKNLTETAEKLGFYNESVFSETLFYFKGEDEGRPVLIVSPKKGRFLFDNSTNFRNELEETIDKLNLYGEDEEKQDMEIDSTYKTEIDSAQVYVVEITYLVGGRERKVSILLLGCDYSLLTVYITTCSTETYSKYEPVFSHMIDSLRCEVPLLESLNLEGRWLLQERRYGEALEKYDELLELEPESVTALNNKGIALRGLHRYEEALEVYDTALTLELDDTRVLYNKADVLTDLGRYSEAIGLLDKVLEKNSSYSDAWMNKAVNLHFLGRYNEALYAYDNVLEDSSRYDREDILLNKIDALNGLGRYDEAITLADEAIEIDPNFDSAWYNKGLTLYYLGYLNRSLECFNKVLELNPSAKDAAANREFIIELMENQTSTT